MENKDILKITRKDIARLAGTSEQTVSYILNGTRRFSPEMEQKVLDIVEKYNYQPDVLAKGLITKKTRSLCVAIDDITNPVIGEIIKSFNSGAMDAKYFSSIIELNKDFASTVSSLIARRIEGLFITLAPTVANEPLLKPLIKAGIKIVLGNKTGDAELDGQVAFVRTDLYGGMCKVVSYLAEKGRKNPVYLSGLSLKDKRDLRYGGFTDSCKKYLGIDGVALENDYPYHTNIEDGYRLAEQLFTSQREFDAVITTNDLMAYGVMECSKKYHKRVGEDFALVGFDNLTYSQWMSPSLTSIGFDVGAYGRAVLDSMLSYIDTGEKPDDVVVPCTLYERDSSK